MEGDQDCIDTGLGRAGSGCPWETDVLVLWMLREAPARANLTFPMYSSVHSAYPPGTLALKKEKQVVCGVITPQSTPSPGARAAVTHRQWTRA